MVAGVCQQRRDVGVGGGSGGDVLAAVEMLYVVNLKVLCCRCTVTLERDGALLRFFVTAHRHARLRWRAVALERDGAFMRDRDICLDVPFGFPVWSFLLVCCFILCLDYHFADCPFGVNFCTFSFFLLLLEYLFGRYVLNCLCEMLGEVLLDFRLDFC